MSRHGFAEILENAAVLLASHRGMDGAGGATEHQDLKGHRLQEWLDLGVVGWDEPMQTYFIQGPQAGDQLSWWLGTTYAEIPTFSMLCRMISLIFDDAAGFEFVDRINTERVLRSVACDFGGNGDAASALAGAKAAATVEPGFVA